MTGEWQVPAWAVVLAVVVMVALVGVVLVAVARVKAAGRRAEAALAAAAADTDDLRAGLADLQRRLEPRAEVDDRHEYVITRFGDEGEGDDEKRPAVPMVPAPVFADILLRESVIRAATIAAGVRRALSPQVRARVRVEMRREVKRARKQRRADVREARRAIEARRRAEARAEAQASVTAR